MHPYHMQTTLEKVLVRLDELKKFKSADWDRKRLDALNMDHLPEKVYLRQLMELENERHMDLAGISRLYVALAAERAILLTDPTSHVEPETDDSFDLNPAPIGAIKE